jgi:hypothetical protein
MCASQATPPAPDYCLGRVESAYARDVSLIRHKKPMCGPCGEAAYEAMPKKLIPRSQPGPRPAAGGTPRPRDEDIAEVPRGEVVGQFTPSDDPDLRALLNS